MNFETIILIISTISGFILSFFGFSFIYHRKINSTNTPISPFFVIFFCFLGISGIILGLFNTSQDFIFNYNLWELVVVLFLTMLVFLNFCMLRYKKTAYILTFFAAVAGSLMTPTDFTLYPDFPQYLTIATIALVWFLFSIFYRYINGIDGVLAINTISICLGVYILSIAGGIPSMIGAFALALGSIMLAFLIFNWYPSKLNLSPAACTAVGFLLGSLLFRTTIEGTGASVSILCMFFLAEMLFAIGKKLSLQEKYKDLMANTAYYQANISGFSPNNICNNIIRLQIVMIILAYFELYAPNIYSVPALSFVITIWYLSKLKNWQTANLTLKEINKDVIKGLKNNFKTIQENINNKDEQPK